MIRDILNLAKKEIQLTSNNAHHEPHVEADLRQVIQSIKLHLDELEEEMLVHGLEHPGRPVVELLRAFDNVLIVTLLQMRTL